MVGHRGSGWRRDGERERKKILEKMRKNGCVQQLLLLLKWNSSNPKSFDIDFETLRQFFSKFGEIETRPIEFNSTTELCCHWPCVVSSPAIPPPTINHSISLTQIKPILASFYLKPITPNFTNLITNGFIVLAMDLKRKLTFSQPAERESLRDSNCYFG